MPIHTGKDKNGSYYQWGNSGEKYYFDPLNKRSKESALDKAKKQQKAIYSAGYKGDGLKIYKLKRVNWKDERNWDL